MNQAMKTAKKGLEKLGYRMTFQAPRTMAFQHPYGREKTVAVTMTLAQVRQMIACEEDWVASMRGDRMSEYPTVREYPRLRPGDVSRSRHFMERVDLMLGQGLNPVDIGKALHTPSSVRTGDGVFYYCYGDIAVSVSREVKPDGRRCAVTLLWTRDALWAANPRPEQERT